MSNKTIVLVACDTFGTHTHQIFCGLNMLRRLGVIELRYVAPPKWLSERRTRQIVYLVVEKAGSAVSHFYDLNDSAELAHEEALKHCDFYHKRSFNEYYYRECNESVKILPFGLNYQMLAGSVTDFISRVVGDWLFHPYNPLSKRQRPHVETILKYSRDLLFSNSKNKEIMLHEQISGSPSTGLKKQVLFQCRLWDPMYFPERARSSIQELNEVRVDTVYALKRELGERFIGGLQNNPYARSVSNDLVVSHSTNRANYLRLVKEAAVVVTTNGISESIGWKMGEFVAASKAIVCEPLAHTLPGGFKDGKNYLSYRTSEDCVRHCLALLEENDLATDIMENNFSYYNQYLRPDMLMLNSFAMKSDIN